jgi:hypothetical protein
VHIRDRLVHCNDGADSGHAFVYRCRIVIGTVKLDYGYLTEGERDESMSNGVDGSLNVLERRKGIYELIEAMFKRKELRIFFLIGKV